MRAFSLFLFVMVVVLSGCSVSEQVVTDGPFQKRKFRPGWHVDLGWRAPEPAVMGPTRRVAGTMRMPLRTYEAPVPVQPTLLASSTAIPLGPVVSAPVLPIGAKVVALAEPPVHTLSSPTAAPVAESGPRRWNRMALISGVFLLLAGLVIAISGGGEILLYLLTFALLTGIIGLILSIKHKERGKGIAIAAIAAPVIIIALVIAALYSDR